jgi:hypothetical protein
VNNYELHLQTHTCHDECQNPICVAVREAVEAERKQWQGLTDEEVQNIEISASSKEAAIYIAEAQLKGKNT